MTKKTTYKGYVIKQRGRTVVVERQDGDLVRMATINNIDDYHMKWAMDVIERDINSSIK